MLAAVITGVELGRAGVALSVNGGVAAVTMWAMLTLTSNLSSREPVNT